MVKQRLYMNRAEWWGLSKHRGYFRRRETASTKQQRGAGEWSSEALDKDNSADYTAFPHSRIPGKPYFERDNSIKTKTNSL